MDHLYITERCDCRDRSNFFVASDTPGLRPAVRADQRPGVDYGACRAKFFEVGFLSHPDGREAVAGFELMRSDYPDG